MGGLSHFIEEEGIATTHISLVREHTETIRPPRALWVPFELGRPLGLPNDPEFQKRVLLSVLNLLEAKTGPSIIEDFPDDAPLEGTGAAPLACPVSFGGTEDSAPKDMGDRFRQEVAGLGTWYRAAVEQRGRTMADTAGLSLDEEIELLLVFAHGEIPENPRPGFDLGLVLKAVGEDIKAYYIESMTARPGGERTSQELNDWFWRDTAASEVFRRIKQFCDDSDDKMLKLMGGFCLVPRVQG